MASSSRQMIGKEGSDDRTTAASGIGGTIWGLGPVQSRMTQNALGDNFVDQFQDNIGNKLPTPIQDKESNMGHIGNTGGSQMPAVKVEADRESDSFGSYFKKMYNGGDNRITKTVTNFPEQRVSAGTRLTQGEMKGLRDMYPEVLTQQENWKSRGMEIGLGDNTSFSDMSNCAQSRSDEEFRFRVGLMDRQTMRHAPVNNGDLSYPVLGFADRMILEEIARQKQRSFLEFQQLEQAQKMKQMMEVKRRQEIMTRMIKEEEIKKRQEAMSRIMQESEMMKRQDFMSRMLQEKEMKKRQELEEKEMLELIQTEQKKKLNSEQVTSPLTNGSEMVEKSQQGVIGQLQEEVEILKKKLNTLNIKNVPSRTGVKNRLGVTARLGNPQETKMNVFKRLGDGDTRDRNTSYKSFSDNQCCPKSGRKRKYENYELPKDLVLTELSDKGPVPARLSGGIARELVLTEFGQTGPIKVTSEWEKLEARTRKIAKKN